MRGLTLAQASTIIDTALSESRMAGIAPLAVVVLDAGGQILALKRDERASLYRNAIAQAKASGCLGMGYGGREIARRAQAMPAFYAAIGGLGDGLIPVPGGVLIRDADGDVIGSVGISGDTADNDERCAIMGIQAAGLAADTGAP